MSRQTRNCRSIVGVFAPWRFRSARRLRTFVSTRSKLRAGVCIIDAYDSGSAVFRLTVISSHVPMRICATSPPRSTAFVVMFSIGSFAAAIARSMSFVLRWKSGSPPPARRTERVPASCNSDISSSMRESGSSSLPRIAAVEQKKQSMLQRSAG